MSALALFPRAPWRTKDARASGVHARHPQAGSCARRRALALTCAALAGLSLSACGGAPAEKPDPEPRPAPAQVEAAPSPTPEPTPAPSPPPPKPFELSLQTTAPAGSSLRLGARSFALPGRIEWSGLAGARQAVSGRLGLNAMSERLRIPSSARENLRGDDTGVWIEVSGRLEVAATEGSAALSLQPPIGEAQLLDLLEGKALTLRDRARRVRLTLRLQK